MKKPTGRRERKKQATRQALMESALRLFGERGIYVTRIEDITEQADVAKGAFYNYFESKAAVVAALVREAAAELDQQYLQPSRAKTLPERLEAAALAHDRFFKASPARALIFHQGRGLLELEHNTESELRDAFTDYLTRLGNFVYPNGKKSKAAALDAASAVAGTIAGYRSFRRASGKAPHPHVVARLLIEGIPSL